MTKIIAIHQPNYLPYLGFFDKMASSDIFVIYDDAQFEKGEFQHRNRIRIYHGWKWLTVPVEKMHILINEIRIKNEVTTWKGVKWADAHFRDIMDNYKDTLYYSVYEEGIRRIYEKRYDKLVELNMELINFLIKAFDIDVEMVFSCEFGFTSKSTERLVEIVEATGGDVYLSGQKGRDYLDVSLFEKRGIEVKFQDYRHPIYSQRYEDFVPNMAAIDALFNTGGFPLSEKKYIKMAGQSVKEIKTKEINLRDKEAQVYDGLISDYQHHVEIVSVLKKLDPQEGEYILDLGCGTGRITYNLIEAGCKVVSVDFSKDSLRVCEQRCSTLHNKNNLCLIQADVCNLPLKDCSVDKCVSSEVLEHVPSEEERLKMLKEIHRGLKSNGKLVLTTYNHSLRKIIGRKRETKNSELYAYRYDFFKLKRIILFIFRGKVKIVGILNLIQWVPINVLNKYERFLIQIDKFIEKTPFSYLLAHLLSVECRKIKNGKK